MIIILTIQVVASDKRGQGYFCLRFQVWRIVYGVEILQSGIMEDRMKQIKWKYERDGFFVLDWEDIPLLKAYATACHVDGRWIDTRNAKLAEEERSEDSKTLILTFHDENGLCLKEKLMVSEAGVPEASCCLFEKDGSVVETRRMIPLVIREGEGSGLKIWKSLWTKMLLVPYDNTMWLRYEAVPLRAGRKSYDLTVLFSEEDREGLLIGAMDFSVWKNAVVCSYCDARNLNVECGVADAGSHDSVMHGSMSGKEVWSGRFCILYGKDYRKLLEDYGDILKQEKAPLQWKEGVPFGFNSWAGLAFRLNEDNYWKTGEFLREELQPAGYGNRGVTYVNLDAGWSVIAEERLSAIVSKLHEKGQKAGIYDAPFAFFGEDIQQVILGAPGHRYEEILLKDDSGKLLPKVDGAIPFDVTHPVWRQQMKWKLERFVKWGFDYVKLDFMTHGGMEGCHYDEKIKTGRQAITQGYEFIADFLSEEKVGRPFFISLSIAPLFPSGYGHARRFSCDAFGTNEDVEYVLNAQTYAWWQSGRLYQYNDPDHICLLRSFLMERDSSAGEARARYTSAVIAGTVMMVSDDYGNPLARERTKQFTGNRRINELAAEGISFCPVESGGDSAAYAFTAKIMGRQYIALFHWKENTEVIRTNCRRAGIQEGLRYKDLWSGEEFFDEGGVIAWKAEGCNAVILEEISSV